MKLKLTYFILAIITFTSWGCHHTNCCVPEPENVMFAMKNNADWNVNASLQKVHSRTDTITVYGQAGGETLNLKLKKVNNAYTLIDAGFATAANQTVLNSLYVLDTTKPNALTITTDNGQHLEATFSLYFNIVYGNPNINAYPATISFKNGNFRVNW